MKLRPQFNLRFRDADQFELIAGEAERDHVSMNEWILLRLESDSVVLKGQRVAAEGKFRGAGKCPHGWKDWMTCRNNGGGCE